MRLIFLGAPGAGKGTQSEILSEKLNIPTISSGSILRAEAKSETPVGLVAKSFLDAGNLVPDDVMISIISQRLLEPDCAGGCILDGFPRTVPQAEALELSQTGVDIAISIEISDEEIISRMSGRLFCPGCDAIYNTVTAPPLHEGVCDKCGSRLERRRDDEPETLRKRLRIYHDETAPLLSFYEERGKLKRIPNRPSIQEVADSIAEALGIN